MAKTRDVCVSVSSRLIVDWYINYPQTYARRAKQQIKISKRVKGAEVFTTCGNSSIVFSPENFCPAESVPHLLP